MADFWPTLVKTRKFLVKIPIFWCPISWCPISWCPISWCPISWCLISWCPIYWCLISWSPISWCPISCFLFSCQKMCHSNSKLTRWFYICGLILYNTFHVTNVCVVCFLCDRKGAINLGCQKIPDSN